MDVLVNGWKMQEIGRSVEIVSGGHHCQFGRVTTGIVFVLGSVTELEEAVGQKVQDLHKHFVDDLEIIRNGKTYKRIPEVLDCWFESGSMPYAQEH